MQPRPNVAFCPKCRKPKDPNEVTCSQCGTRVCPNGHIMVSRICSLCGWEDRSWKPQTRSYVSSIPIQKPQDIPDAKESICPRCNIRTVVTSGHCINCGYIFETGRYGGTQQTAASSLPQSGSTFQPAARHDIVQQQFPGVHDARREYVCPRCGAKADPRDGACQNCGYIGSLEYEIPQQQVPGGAPPPKSSSSTQQQSFAGQQFVHVSDTSQSRACPFCGESIPSDSKFCQRCGKASGSGRQHEKHIPVTDRIMSGDTTIMSRITPSMDTAYAAEPAPGNIGAFMPEVGGISIPEREFPREREKTKRTRDKKYTKEKKGFPLTLLAAILVVAAALVAMVIFTVSQIVSTPTSTTVTPVVDNTPPEISDVSISSVAGSSALIEWTTDEKATSQVKLCTDTDCVLTDPDATLVRYHEVNLNDIKLDIPYHVTVMSIDSSGNESSFDMEHTFATESVPDTIPVGYEVGNRAPNFTLEDLDGNNVTLSSFRGSKIVMVNFWSSTCSPCVAELPDFEQVYQARSGSVEIFAVNAGEGQATVQNFIESANYTFKVLLDSDGTVRSSYNITLIPKTFFIDKEGIIRNIPPGQIDKSQIDSILNNMQ